MTGNRALLTNFMEKFLGTICFDNNDFAVIAGYGDVFIESMTIKKIYYVEGLGHNLFSVGQFCDKGLEVAFRKSTCFIRNEDGVELLTGDRSSNLYTIVVIEVASNFVACLLEKASSLQSWLWHQRLSHLNFATSNNLVKNNLVQVSQVSETSKKDLEDLFQKFYEYFDSSKIMKSSTTNVETSNVEIPSNEEEVFHGSSESFQEGSSSSSLNDDVHQSLNEVMVNPNEHHVSAVKRIFCYLKWTIKLGLWYPKDYGFDLTPYPDADHAECHLDRKTESEYVVVSSYCAQVLWMSTQLTGYGFFNDKVPIYCDSKSAIAISCNPVQHTRTKHIDVSTKPEFKKEGVRFSASIFKKEEKSSLT
nr:copia protein [Tanacetum cinerariifolium]